MAHQQSPELPLTSTGRPIVLAGLGNHEAAERTHGRPLRSILHNAGFELIDALRRQLGLNWQAGRGCWWTPAQLSGAPELTIFLAAPHAGDLNSSGRDLALDFPSESVTALSVHDDMDLPPLGLRLRAGGSDAGHKGLRDLSEVYGTVPRLRVGIGRRSSEHGEVAPGSQDLPAYQAQISPAYRAGLERLAQQLSIQLGPQLRDLRRQGQI